MTRRREEVRAALVASAALTPATAVGASPGAPGETWHDLLVDPAGPSAGPGARFSRPGDPDRALLDALTDEYVALDAHAATLPARAHLDWLERVLGVPRLPVVPDQVVAHVTVDPRRAPAVLPRGTLLRGGKDAFGADRRYATTDALTAHGAAVVGVRSLVPGGHAGGRPGLAGSSEPGPGKAPMPALDPHAAGPAVHTLRLHSPVLTFDGGSQTVEVAFGGTASAADLAAAGWSWSRTDGTAGGPATGAVSGNRVTVVLDVSCGAPAGEQPWLEARLPEHVPVPSAFAFSAVSVRVAARSAIVPQAAYLNDGLLDVTKEFTPFGPAARRGDALYVRCDEALAKPLATLTMTLSVMNSSGAALSPSVGGTGIPANVLYGLTSQFSYLQTNWGSGGTNASAIEDAFIQLGSILSGGTTPKVVWQRRVDGRWTELKDVGATLTGFTGVAMSARGSEAAVVGGELGHSVRAFLAEGDFGWTDYQQKIAQFATDAVAGTPGAEMPVPPVPPVISELTLSYTTADTPATAVTAVNGWARTTLTGPALRHPFTRLVAPTGETGMVAVGLDLPDGAVGSSVSVYLGVESAAPCGTSADPDAGWQWWDGAGWQPLAVADGSRLLRESGLLRFVAPHGWARGCPDVGADAGRWVRMVTRAPDRVGVLTSVTPDAVVAAFVSSAPDPATDPSPDVALPPGTIKGTLVPVPGVSKVTNLAGVRGRGPEDDGAYRRRASAQARHRGRAVSAWDYQEIVAVAFPEVAAVRCLPHTAADGTRQAGAVGVVVVPDRPTDRAPRPSVSLAARVLEALAGCTPVHATPAVLCALYVPATVEAVVVLRPGVAALTGLDAVTAALDAWLHPTAGGRVRWGRALYRSAVETFLDALPEVDHVGGVVLRGSAAVGAPAGSPTEVLTVDACRGLTCSSGAHLLDVQEQL